MPQAFNVEDTSDPMEDPVIREKVETARNFTFHLLKGIKQIGMYRHNEAKFPEFLARAHEAVEAYTEKFGALSMKVEQQNLLLLGQALFSEDSALPFKFYRDGIRQLIFRSGVTVEELVSFTLIALSEPERGAEDVLAQLWKAGLEHVEYVVVEGFKMDGVSEQEVQVEVDHVVNYLYARLKTNSEDYLRFARVSMEDLETSLEGVEQMRGLVVSGNYASDELKARLQREIEEEENSRLFPKLMSAIFQVLETGMTDVVVLEEVFLQLLDAMLLQDDFGSINQIVLRLRAMAQREEQQTVMSGMGMMARLFSFFTQKMGEEQRLLRISEVLKSTRPKNPADISRYLAVLDSMALFPLLTALETIEIAENRQLLCDVLAPFATETPDPFVARLESDRPQVVRDMVYILEKSGHPERLKMFAKVLRHPNLALKLEAMNIIARSATMEGRRLVLGLIDDPMPQVRMHAVRLLTLFGAEKAYLDLVRIVRDPAFEKKAGDERAAFYTAIASTGVVAALQMLQQILLAKPTLLNKRRVLEDKLLVLQGLTTAGTIQSYKLVLALVEDKSQPVEVLTAARRSMYQLRKSLFGDTTTPEEA